MTSSRSVLRTPSLVLATAGAACLFSCAPKVENSSGFPVKPNDITLNNVDPLFKTDAAKNKASLGLWDALSEALGLAPIDTAELTTLSPATTAKLGDLANPISLALETYGPRLRTGMCASIDSMTRLGKAANSTGQPIAASVYLMAFKRQNADGTNSSTVNYGLVTTPDLATNAYPILAFGHPGSGSLDYSHVAGLLGDLQLGTIVLAPAFAGENIVGQDDLTIGTRTATDYFDTDADIMLGMLDCVTNSFWPSTASNPIGGSNVEGTQETIGTHFATRYKHIDDALGTAGALPRTIFAGADIGGLVSNIALAKAGALWSIYKLKGMTPNNLLTQEAIAGAQSVWNERGFTNATVKPTVGCAANIASPASGVHGEYRIALRYSVAGSFASSAFSQSPFAIAMDGLVAPYVAKGLQVETTSTAREIMKRDALYTAPLATLALRDWRTAFLVSAQPDTPQLPGKMFFMHGTNDSAIFTNQTAMLSGMIAAASATLSSTDVGFLAPGVKTVALGVTPKDGETDVFSLHLGDGFLKGKPMTAAASADTKGPGFTTTDPDWAAVEANTANMATPASAFGAWYENVCGLKAGD